MAKVVAVIGASSDRRKFGNKALRAFRKRGYIVIPVNPNEPEVEGLSTFPTVLDIPGGVDMATFYVRPDEGEHVVDHCAQKGIREIWLNPGADGANVIARARALGIEPIQACSIVAIGENPYAY